MTSCRNHIIFSDTVVVSHVIDECIIYGPKMVYFLKPQPTNYNMQPTYYRNSYKKVLASIITVEKLKPYV